MVTDLVEIRRLGEAKIAENLHFRRYLRKHHPDDRDFRVLAQEIEKNYDCTACGNCCRETTVDVTPAEIEEIARYLALEPEQVVSQYTTPATDPKHRTLRQTADACLFLDKKLCMIYEARPRACRDFPHVDEKGRSLGRRMSSICRSACFCPIIYNAIEEYKQLVGYPGPAPDGAEDRGI